MKPTDTPLNRLLRAAAAAPPRAGEDSATVPGASWLLRQCRQSEPAVPPAVRLALRRGLALACLLLLVSSLLHVRQIAQSRLDLFSVPETALTRLATP
jgi:hypothetical protein